MKTATEEPADLPQAARRALLIGAFGAALLRPSSLGAQPGPADAALPSVSARQVMLVDAGTGSVLLNYHAEEPIAPGLLGKLMTAYVVFDTLRTRRMDLGQTFVVSRHASDVLGSRMFLRTGSAVPIEALLRGVILGQANDACLTLAEGIAGSESAFVELMHDAMSGIGLRGSTIRNATGRSDSGQHTTCADLAALAGRIITEFPEYYRLYGERSFTWAGITQANRNPALTRVLGADGLQAGRDPDAGFQLVASAARGDRRVILVCAGIDSARARADDSAFLLELGLRGEGKAPL